MPEHGLPSLSSCTRKQDTGPGRSPSACRLWQSFLALPSEKAKEACRRHARTRSSASTSLRRHDPHQVSGSKPNFLSALTRSPLYFPLEGCPGLRPERVYYPPPAPLCQSPFERRGGDTQYFRSRISTMSPMTPSSQWHSSLAPQSLTSWAQLAGAKGMADRAIMGMSFWLSPTQ